MANILFEGFTNIDNKVPEYFEKVQYSSSNNIDLLITSNKEIYKREDSKCLSLYFEFSIEYASTSSRLCYLKIDTDLNEKIFFGFRYLQSYLKEHYIYYYVVRLCGENDTCFDVRMNARFIVLPNEARIETQANQYIEIGYDGVHGIIRVNGVVVWKEAVVIGLVKEIRLGQDKDYNEASYIRKFHIQDIYMNNGQGSINNDFWGDTKMDLVTVTGDGEQFTGFSCSEEAPPYSLIDEIPPDMSATFIQSAQLGAKATFNMASVSDNEQLKGVRMDALATKMATSDSGMKLCAVYNGIVYSGEKIVPPVGSYATYTMNMNTAPDGTPWSNEKYNLSEFGLEVVA